MWDGGTIEALPGPDFLRECSGGCRCGYVKVLGEQELGQPSYPLLVSPVWANSRYAMLLLYEVVGGLLRWTELRVGKGWV